MATTQHSVRSISAAPTAKRSAIRTFATSVDMPAADRAKVNKVAQSAPGGRLRPHEPGQAGALERQGLRLLAAAQAVRRGRRAGGEWVDELAERVTALGGYATGTVRMAAAASTLPEFPTEITEQHGLRPGRRRRGSQPSRTPPAARSTRPTSWATPTRPISSPRSAAAPTSTSTSSRRTSRTRGAGVRSATERAAHQPEDPAGPVGPSLAVRACGFGVLDSINTRSGAFLAGPPALFLCANAAKLGLELRSMIGLLRSPCA